jgi:CRP-like cAMP-binding protein
MTGEQMNVTAILWARTQTSLSLVEKSILLHLASFADEAFKVAEKSQQAIAKLTGCTRAAANKALGNLEGTGLISVVQQFRDDGGQLACLYVLHVDRSVSNR